MFRCCHWTNAIPFPPWLPLSFHTHAQPLNNDNNDQDGYYRILLAVAKHQFHGSTQNCDFPLFKSCVGHGVGTRGSTIWIITGSEKIKVIVLPAALIPRKLVSSPTS